MILLLRVSLNVFKKVQQSFIRRGKIFTATQLGKIFPGIQLCNHQLKHNRWKVREDTVLHKKYCKIQRKAQTRKMKTEKGKEEKKEIGGGGDRKGDQEIQHITVYPTFSSLASSVTRLLSSVSHLSFSAATALFASPTSFSSASLNAASIWTALTETSS